MVGARGALSWGESGKAVEPIGKNDRPSLLAKRRLGREEKKGR